MFSNTADRKFTIRIDSKLLAQAEAGDTGKKRADAAEELRRVVATVGKVGEPGEHVRCVVSVAMLTEGWDANTVTQVLGLRAFTSQLLCEQVVGRGLRRMDYKPDPATGLLTEEYCDVYGVPFSVIPFRGRPVNKPEPDDTPPNLVKALPERAAMEIAFSCRGGLCLRPPAEPDPLRCRRRWSRFGSNRTGNLPARSCGLRLACRCRGHGRDAVAFRLSSAGPRSVLRLRACSDDLVPGGFEDRR